ncbi:MAG: efflux RND transporter periplasmic adaptor subunit [Betaproteobacteria bacterium]
MRSLVQNANQLTRRPLIMIASVAAAAVLASGCSSEPRATASERAEVTASVARAEETDLPVQFEAGGVVRARETAVISSRVLAPVVDVRVRPGDRVRRGEPLVRLDARDLAANAVQASAGLDAARQAGDAARSEEQAAEAALQLARATHERISSLHAKRAATAQELDEAVAGLRAAEARAAGSRARVKESASGLEAAKAAADAAGVTASYAVLTAPFDGVVAERRVDPGTVAAPGMPLLTVEAVGAFHLEAALDESRASALHVGDAAGVRLDTAPGPPAWLAGRIAEIARLDPATHSFVVKVAFDAPADVRSGLFGRARFTSGTHRTLVAPAAALVRRGQLSFVYAVSSDGLARLRPVTVGSDADGRVEIVAGLAAGEDVVVNPPPTIADGVRVRRAAAGRPGEGR